MRNRKLFEINPSRQILNEVNTIRFIFRELIYIFIHIILLYTVIYKIAKQFSILTFVIILIFQAHVYHLMKSDSYSRYLRSEMYKDFLNGSKKKVIILFCVRML